MSKWLITYLKMGCIGVTTHLLTFDRHPSRWVYFWGGLGWWGGGVGLGFLVEERKEGNQEICRPTVG